MVGMDGFDFLESIKNIPGCEALRKRVVVLSSSMLQKDIDRAFSYGIHAYLVKPLTVEKVEEILKGLEPSPVAVSEE